jgi:hypothetical protein
MEGCMMKTYHVRTFLVNPKILEIMEACSHDVAGVPHINMNDFVKDLLNDALSISQDAEDSGLPPYQAVMHHFGFK